MLPPFSPHTTSLVLLFFSSLMWVGENILPTKEKVRTREFFFSSELITGCWRSHSAADRPLSKLHCPCLLPTSLNSSITLSAMNKRPNKTINPSLFVSSLDACRGEETQVGPGQRILIPGFMSPGMIHGIMSPWQPLEIPVSVTGLAPGVVP